MKIYITTLGAFLFGVSVTGILDMLNGNTNMDPNMSSGRQAKTTRTAIHHGSLRGGDIELYNPLQNRQRGEAGKDEVPGFDGIVATAYNNALLTLHEDRPTFDIKWWERRSGRATNGGLTTKDRMLLADIYSKAHSVFEYGLGESTYMADYLQVPRYAGIDSGPNWVDKTRQRVSDRFRFYLADVGKTGSWGFPAKPDLAKNVLNYQLAPLLTEQLPFDVYMVDGRWRLASALASFLHASARGAEPTETIVLIHDCNPSKIDVKRESYYLANHLLYLTRHSGDLLCVFQRGPETTDEQLMQLWQEHMDIVQR